MAFNMPYENLEELRKRFTLDQIQEFRDKYALFDVDKDGIITTGEVGTVMRACGLELTDKELHQSLDEFSGEDPDNVDFPQFLTIMARKFRQKQVEEDMNELREAFKIFDKDGNGRISVCILRSIIVNLGESMKGSLADRMIKDADIYSEGLVDIEAFIQKLCQPSHERTVTSCEKNLKK